MTWHIVNKFEAIFENNNLLILKPLCHVHMTNMKRKKSQSQDIYESKIVFCLKLHNRNFVRSHHSHHCNYLHTTSSHALNILPYFYDDFSAV